MERRSVEAIVEALNRAGARYLIAGGLAVVAHGHVRFTADVDVVLDPERGNLERALKALAGLGYRPRAPVELIEFADAAKRAAWARDKGMTVFSLFSPEHPATEVDLFLDAPIDFAAAYMKARREEVAPGVAATFVGYDDLVAMKTASGRPMDLQDVRELNQLHRRNETR